jgi:hypothetical protein
MLSFAAFESIDVSESPESVEAWTAEEMHVQRERVHNVTVIVTFRLGLVVFRKTHARTTIGTVPIRISYVPHVRSCVGHVSCLRCVGHVLCCALL